MKPLFFLALTILAVTGHSGADSVVLVPVADATVWQGNPGSNYGSTNELTVGFVTGWCNTLIEFDLASLTGATINSAAIYFYVWELNGAVPVDELYVGRNDSDWQENIVTWDTRPYFSGISPIPQLSDLGWWEIDVTGLVQEFVNGTCPNYGFQVFKGDYENATIRTRSREYGSFSPYLMVYYEPQALENATFGAIKAMFR
ncbi:MAG: DNRLRE domain-containing protein [Candidatus Fermentibacteraceae bacterium]|nr:DNRLRE domain-containing protein [Candidatus Fermentibacteraceae bacterium]